MSEPPDSSGNDSGTPPSPPGDSPSEPERLSRFERRLQSLEEKLDRLAASVSELADAFLGETTASETQPPAIETEPPPQPPEEELAFFSPEQIRAQATKQAEASKKTNAATPSVRPAATPTPPADVPPSEAPSSAPAASTTDAQASPASTYRAPQPPSPPPPSAAPASLEARIGQIWVSRAGLVLVLVALALFLKWAYDRNLISYELRTALGVLSGLALLGLGEVLRRRMPRYAQAFTGAGIAALYLSFYAAYALYQLFGQTTSFAFMVVTTALAVALALRHDAPAIAGLGILGGFAVPYLLAGGEPRMEGMLVYYLILQAGLLVAIPRLSRFREILLLLSVLAGYGAAALPALAGTPVRVEVWLLYFLLLSSAVAWLTVRCRTLMPEMVRPLLAILALLPFLTPAIADPVGDRPHAALAYVLAAYFGFLLLDRLLARQVPAVISMATAAALLATLAVRARAFAPHTIGDAGDWWYVVVCGALCVLAVLTTARTRRDPTWVAVLVGGPIGILQLLMVDDPSLAAEAVFPAVLLLLGIASLLMREYPAPADVPPLMLGALMFGGYLYNSLGEHDLDHLQGALLLVLGALYAAAAWQASRLRPDEPLPRLALAGVAVIFFTLFFPAQFDTATVTIAWAVEAAVLTFIGLRLQQPSIWKSAWAVLIAALLRYLLFDTGLPGGLEGVPAFLNQHTLSVLALTVCGLLMAGWLVAGTESIQVSRKHQDRRAGAALCFLIANGVLLLGVTLEVDLYFDAGGGSLPAGVMAGGRPAMQQFVLTAYYALHSIALVMVGLQQSIRAARMLGLLLFAGTLAKLILVDLSFLDTIYRVFSFLAVGVLLVVASLLYQRFKERLEADSPS